LVFDFLPGQNTSSHGVPASSAARIVGDHGMSRPSASWSFHRWMAASASARAALSVHRACFWLRHRRHRELWCRRAQQVQDRSSMQARCGLGKDEHPRSWF
jgi:hypothetical protein